MKSTYTTNYAKPLLAVLASALLTLAAAACGGKSPGPRSSAGHGTAATQSASGPSTAAGASTAVAPRGGHLTIDGDQDDDDKPGASPAVNDDRELLETYGGSAGPADARAIASLVKTYYAAALAGDAARACSLLHADIAAQLAAQQGAGGQSAPAGRSGCAQAMSTMLAQQRQQLLADEVPTMLILSVHVKGDLGLAALGFRRMPEAEIVLEREGGTWKLGALFDTDMT